MRKFPGLAGESGCDVISTGVTIFRSVFWLRDTRLRGGAAYVSVATAQSIGVTFHVIVVFLEPF